MPPENFEDVASPQARREAQVRTIAVAIAAFERIQEMTACRVGEYGGRAGLDLTESEMAWTLGKINEIARAWLEAENE